MDTVVAIHELTREDLQALVQAPSRPCVSLYMPVSRAEPRNQDNRIRLKNLVQAAEREALALGIGRAELLALVEPLRRVAEAPELWRVQGEGLAIFRNPDLLRVYHLPLAPSEQAIVNDRFEIKALLPLLTDDGRFFVLSLSLSAQRLIEATRHAAREVPLKGLPDATFEETLQRDTPEFGATQRADRRPGVPGGPTGGGTHGIGVDTDDLRNKEKIVDYFRAVARAIHPHLAGGRAPLVLATVRYLAPLFRQACDYKHIVDATIDGNPDLLTPDDLRQRGWAIVEPLFQENRERVAALYKQFAGQGNGRASNDPREVLAAARHGRVAALFAAEDEHLWGRYWPEHGRVEIHDDVQPGDDDLLDLAAVHTFANSGAVFVLPRRELPDPDSPIAAVYHY